MADVENMDFIQREAIWAGWGLVVHAPNSKLWCSQNGEEALARGSRTTATAADVQLLIVHHCSSVGHHHSAVHLLLLSRRKALNADLVCKQIN